MFRSVSTVGRVAISTGCFAVACLGAAFAQNPVQAQQSAALTAPNSLTQSAVDALDLPQQVWEVVEPAEVHHALRQAGRHPVDELDRPRFTRRRNHRGFEVRTFHFVVTSTSSEQQAEDVAAALEDTWRDLGKLGDAFTATHRQPTFGLGSVGVLVSDRPFADRSLPHGPNPASAEADIYLFAPAEQAGNELLADLRQQAARSWLRTTQLDQTLPAWTQDGLVQLVARQSEPALPAEISANRSPLEQASSEPSAQRPILPALHTSPVTWLVRETADRLPAAPASQGAAEALGYLLLADDAAGAPQTLRALAELIAATPAAGPAIARPRQAVWADAERTAWIAARQATFTPENVSGQDDFSTRFSQWTSAPWRDVPELTVSDNSDSELVRHAADLLVLLKLARRRTAPPPSSIQPQVQEWRDVVRARLAHAEADEHEGEAAEGDPDVAVAPVADRRAKPAKPLAPIGQLLAELADPQRAPWATLDAQGRLLLWYDSPRVAALVDQSERRFTQGEHEGQPTLEAHLPDGRVALAWWSEPSQADERPRVQVRWR